MDMANLKETYFVNQAQDNQDHVISEVDKGELGTDVAIASVVVQSMPHPDFVEEMEEGEVSVRKVRKALFSIAELEEMCNEEMGENADLGLGYGTNSLFQKDVTENITLESDQGVTDVQAPVVRASHLIAHLSLVVKKKGLYPAAGIGGSKKDDGGKSGESSSHP